VSYPNIWNSRGPSKWRELALARRLSQSAKGKRDLLALFCLETTTARLVAIGEGKSLRKAGREYGAGNRNVRVRVQES